MSNFADSLGGMAPEKQFNRNNIRLKKRKQ